MNNGTSKTIKQTRRVFASIAFWQFLAFFMLLLLIWVNEVLGLPHILYGASRAPVNFFGAAILSSFVLLIAIVTVGHTYVQQTRILKGFITVCANCHKVRIRQDVWQGIEGYIASSCEVTFSHGLCPECYATELQKLRDEEKSGGA